MRDGLRGGAAVAVHADVAPVGIGNRGPVAGGEADERNRQEEGEARLDGHPASGQQDHRRQEQEIVAGKEAEAHRDADECDGEPASQGSDARFRSARQAASTAAAWKPAQFIVRSKPFFSGASTKVLAA